MHESVKMFYTEVSLCCAPAFSIGGAPVRKLRRPRACTVFMLTASSYFFGA